MSQIVSEIDIESRRLRIINAVVASVDQPPGSQVGPRLQRHVQMLLIHSGSMKVVIDERPPYEVHAGHMCILLPGHREEISFPHKMTRQTLLRGDFLGLTAGMAEWLESVPPVRKLSSALTYLAREALTSEQTRLTAQGALVDALSTALLWRFIAELENSPAALPEPIEAARLFIHQLLSEELTLSAIASAANVTPAYLVRLFREHMGTTPIHYLWERRVTHGIVLLTSTGLPIGTVAAMSGFKTSFHFARKVKESTGMAPSELRRSNWGELSAHSSSDANRRI
ncbi:MULTISPECIES: AraC family transcriptional regulator [Paenarthrobacter]|uniref:helix-turn-helix domain-containing protein n=1 Tax=Paenarthrobacter TaxID=1742992 RepID=UPI0013E3B7BD|nr:AraC family transcriptional regulator [Paenarthrobacter ureafaciens]